MRGIIFTLLLLLPGAGCEKETRKNPLAHLIVNRPDVDGIVQAYTNPDETLEALQRQAAEERAENLKRDLESAIGTP